MKVNKKEVARFLIAAIVGAITWSVFLTPYVLLISHLTMAQYFSWLLMEFTLVPAVASPVFFITKWVMRKLHLD